MINAGKTLSAYQLAERCALSPEFRLGYDSYVKGVPFDYKLAETGYYERGRAFAIFTAHSKAPKPTWRQNALSKAARERVAASFMAGYLR